MRLSVCNEIFEGMSIERQFETIADAGYHAVELAPYTLGRPVEEIDRAERRRIRDAARVRGLDIVAMHWLLAGTTGLHVASPDPEVRRRTTQHLVELSRFCQDVGGRYLVFGSPAQRSTPDGMSRREARRLAVDTVRRWAEASAGLDVTICLESLPEDETDFMTTVDEALSVVAEVRAENTRVVLDVKSMSAEGAPLPEVIRRAAGSVAYVQANDANRGGPGFGDTDFVAVFRALASIGYDGVVSVEAFDVSAGAEYVARESNAYLRRSAAEAGVPIDD